MQKIEDAKTIFSAALKRVDPALMLKELVGIDGNTLVIRTETDTAKYDLGRYSRIVVVGAGKASAKMALGLEAVLGDRITSGLVAVKEGHTEKLEYVDLIEAAHPMPDKRCVEAAKRIGRICSDADEKTLILNLISGGGSALLTAPYQNEAYAISLDDIQAVTGLLLACGAVIQEINVIRKHLSAVQGGRLAGFAAPATMVSLILSDVIGDPLTSIASGPTVPDPTTYKDAWNIFRKYSLEEKLPESVARIITDGAAGKVPETPGEGDKIFETVRNILIGTNISALYAASEEAEKLGYAPVILSSQLTGEAREIAKLFSGMAKDLSLNRLSFKKPACIIAGGETTVTLKGKGKGGRNQEMALAFLMEYLDDPDALEKVVFLSGGTDGNDGPTDAAGGLAHIGIMKAMKDADLDPAEYINNSDSYHFLKKTGGLLMTGPTNTNVCDVQILLAE